MTDDLFAALLGPYGLVVGLLILSTLFYRGQVLSRRVVHRDDHNELLAINAAYAEKFGEQTAAVERLVEAYDRLAEAIRAAGVK